MKVLNKKENTSLEVVKLSEKAKLIVSKKLLADISYLHNKVGSIEWSGPLFYSIVSGNILDPANLVIKAERVYPMDIGSASFTEYEFGTEIMDAYDMIGEGAEDMKLGHCHSHHKMNTFFSGTDDQELQDNAPSHNYYLSLIVNFDSEYKAKIAFIGHHKSNSSGSIVFKGDSGDDETMNLGSKATDKKVLVTVDMDIEFENDAVFIEKTAKLQEPKVKPAVYHHYNYGKEDESWNSYDGYEWYGNTYKKNKKYKDTDYIQSDLPFDQPLDYSETNVSSFLVKLLSNDTLAEGNLSVILDQVDRDTHQSMMKMAIDAMDDNIREFHKSVFNKANTDENISKLSVACIDILKRFYNFAIAEELTDMFEDYLTDKDEKALKKGNYNYNKKQWKQL